MATEHSTQEPAARELHFTAAVGLYQLNPVASNLDLYNQLTARLSQLAAALKMVTGEGAEYFACISEKGKDDYLWNCSMLADECYELARHIGFGQYDEGGKEANHG